MAPRKTKAVEVQSLLGEVAAVAPELLPAGVAVPPAALIEYQVDGNAWRCSKFDLLVAELEEPTLTRASLPLLQLALAGRERPWLILRRLFGLMPVAAPKTYPLEDLRSWTRGDLRDALGLTAAQLQAELDAIRGLWKQIAPKPVQASAPAPVMRPLFADDEILRRYEFRVIFRDIDERVSFVKRVTAFEKLLNEASTAGVTRNALMTEFQIRRLDEELSNPNEIGKSTWHANMKLRGEQEKSYSEQMVKLDKLAPWSNALTSKYNFKGVVSDITAAYQAYYANQDNLPRDGIFTATEIEVECRQSVQSPEPRYRAGLVVYLAHCKASLYDPNFKPQFTPRQLGKLDAAWKAAFVAAGADAGEPLPDLEKEGPTAEYPTLHAALPTP